MQSFPDDVVERINAILGGYNRVMGLRFVAAVPDRLVAELEVADCHRQPYGLVHGGVYAGMIESVCSTGAALSVMAEGRTTVGVENSTAFLKAVREGTLRCTAQPLSRGRRSQVWQAEVRDDKERLVASGRVRLLVLEPGTAAAGQAVGLAGEGF